VSSRVSVINRALIKLGVQTIADPDEESEPARVSKQLFDGSARAELRKNPWCFATRRAQLAAALSAPAFGFTRAFPLPSDFVRLVQAGDYYDFAAVRHAPLDRSVVPYRIEGAQLLTDWPAPLNIRYVADLSADPGQWDAAFIDAFSFRLAAEMCGTLTGSDSKTAMLDKQYSRAIGEARRLNAIETPPEPLPDNSWTTTRFF
jgi:hypothetical protein